MFPYTEKQASHNHFHPCTTGDVSSRKDKCSCTAEMIQFWLRKGTMGKTLSNMHSKYENQAVFCVGNQQICECDFTLLLSGTTRDLDWRKKSSL